MIGHAEGHARVVAAAGSGKTATLVARVVALLQRGVEPGRLRVLMFNRSARDDFQRRLDAAVYEAGLRARVSVQTFHGAGQRLTQRLEREGVLPARRLETSEWRPRLLARSALEETLKSTGAESPDVSDEDLDAFATFVDHVKADIRDPRTIRDEAPAGDPWPPHYVAAYQRFEDACSEQRLRTFADLIHEPVRALLEDPGLAARFRDHFDHLIVDEYQDVNEAQQQFLRLVAGERAAVMVVGDPDQCVYQWRGARPEYMMHRFSDDFPGAVRYELPHTFRFGHSVALIGNHVVTRNRARDAKLCLPSPNNEPTAVVRTVERDPGIYREVVDNLRDTGYRLSDVAVLVRLYSQAAPLELDLLEAGVPLRLDGRSGLFQRGEIRALLGYLRVAAGTLFEPAPDGSVPAAELIAEMLMLPLCGLRRQDAQNLAGRVARDALGRPDGYPVLRQALQRLSEEMPRWKGRRIRERIDFLDGLRTHRGQISAGDAYERTVHELGLFEALQRSSPRREVAADRILLCEALGAFVQRSAQPVQAFLERCDELMERSAVWRTDPPAESLRITSVHRAKGLEWPVVLLPGLAEGRFPYLGDDAEAYDVEAERRLFYVAITRARERLILLHPEDALLEAALKGGRQRFDPTRATASRFLVEGHVDAARAAGEALDRGETPSESAGTPLLRDYLQSLGGDA